MRSMVCDRANKIPYSGIRKIFERASTVTNAVHLEAGEPDMLTPAYIREAAKSAMDAGATHYTSSAGTLELRKAIANKLKRENKLDYDSSNEIIVAAGANTALSLAFLTLADAGSEVLVPDPGWANYEPGVSLTGAVPVGYSLLEQNDFRPDVGELEKLVTERTRVLLVNSPGNPTGGVFSSEDLRHIADFAIEHDLAVISDEVYEKIVYDETETQSIASFPSMKERTVVVNALSKTYAMTGWRLGYAATTNSIASAMTKLHSCIASCASSVSQAAAVAALNGPQTDVKKMVSEFKSRRDYFVEALNQIPGFHCRKPRGAFYAFANISELSESSEALVLEILDKAGVVSVPGSAFGAHGEGYIRFSYAASMDNLKEAVRRLEKWRQNRSR